MVKMQTEANGPGRPKVGPMLRVRMSEEMQAQLAQIAQDEYGMNVSEFVRSVVVGMIEKRKGMK